MSKLRLLAKKRVTVLAVITPLALAIILTGSFKSLLAEGENTPPHVNYIPVVSQPGSPPSNDENVLTLVNQFRAEAGVPPVIDNSALNKNCFEHARYMAENNILAHDQDPSLPFASSNGQNCAKHANAWLGSRKADPGWSPNDSVRGWMASVGHRLWILYPTTQTVGYGFFTVQEENRAAAALDILSFAKFNKDKNYSGWPVKYPQGKVIAPSTRYPITLNWSYFGGIPELAQTQLQTAGGQILEHDAGTNLPVGHKGIQIIPKQDLPPNSKIIITVSGTYEGQPFTYTWDFQTGG